MYLKNFNNYKHINDLEDISIWNNKINWKNKSTELFIRLIFHIIFDIEISSWTRILLQTQNHEIERVHLL